jgi:hypothetical protein
LFVSSNPLSRNHDGNHKLRYIASTEIYTPYTCTAGMLPHENGKFTIGKLKPSPLSEAFVLNKSSLSISRCRSEADLAASVVSFISDSMGYRYTINKITKLKII